MKQDLGTGIYILSVAAAAARSYRAAMDAMLPSSSSAASQTVFPPPSFRVMGFAHPCPAGHRQGLCGSSSR